MKRAAGIITNSGGRTCHAAIVSRELGLPAIVGTLNGTERLSMNQAITLSCAEGDTGFVYNGTIPFHVKKYAIDERTRPKTKIMMNVGTPDEAFVWLRYQVTESTCPRRVHYFNLRQSSSTSTLEYDSLDKSTKPKLTSWREAMPINHNFTLIAWRKGIAMIAAAFYPKDVILRLSDFKTNEYANLIGGKKYEPHEENPMIGFRELPGITHRVFKPHLDSNAKQFKKCVNKWVYAILS